MQPGRKYDAGSGYRYGFNGKENSPEINSGAVSFEARIYDSRIGRFFSKDRLTIITPHYSPYIFAGNKPIAAIDQNGDVEIIVNVYKLSKDGKTMVKSFTNRIIIETVEDLRGIDRTPIIVNVYTQMKTKEYKNGNSITYWDEPVAYAAAIQEGSGQSYEDRMWPGKEGAVSKWLYKGMVKFWPPAKIADAWGDNGRGDRDPVNVSFRDPAKKYLQTAEALFDIATLGRGAIAKDGMKKLGYTYFKKLVDWGAEEAIKIATNKLGLGSDKANILGYYVLKYAWEAKSGDIKSLFKILETSVKLGHKGQDAITDLKNGGINLDIPRDRQAAAQQAVTASGYNDVKVIE